VVNKISLAIFLKNYLFCFTEIFSFDYFHLFLFLFLKILTFLQIVSVQLVPVAAVFCAKVSLDGLCNSTGFSPFFFFFLISDAKQRGEKKEKI
jgi:hypothetical protein